jgi:hypothetical protein
VPTSSILLDEKITGNYKIEHLDGAYEKCKNSIREDDTKETFHGV